MYCDMEEMLRFLFDFSSDTVEGGSFSSFVQFMQISGVIVLCTVVCFKFDTVAKFNESVHSSPVVLTEAVVGHPV